MAARAGAGLTHLAPFLARVAYELPQSEFDVFVTRDFTDRQIIDRIAWVEIDIGSGPSLGRLFWDLVRLPWRARGYDAVLSPLNFGPAWSPRPHVLLHRNALYFDVGYRRSQNVRGRVLLGLYRSLAIAESNGAAAVIVPTESMAVHLRRWMRHSDRLSVAGHGIDAEAAWLASGSRLVHGADGWASADVRLLHVGSPGFHKGLDVLARTLADVRDSLPARSVALAVSFRSDDPHHSVRSMVKEVARLGLDNNVHYLGTLAHGETFPLYRNASVFLFPSSVESFGNPVLEAFSVGTPVVASDLPSIVEVSGGLAYTHNVDDYRAAAALVLKALAEDCDARQEALRRYAQAQDPADESRVVALELRNWTLERAR